MARRAIVLGALPLVVAAAGGCGGARWRKPTWLVNSRDAGRYAVIALKSPSADARREAVAYLATTPYATHETVVNTCCVVARTDESESVRCSAIDALVQGAHPRGVDALIELLRGVDDRSVVAGARVRAHALDALRRLIDRAAVPEARMADVVRVAAERLRTDRSRDARIAAARLLGRIADREGVFALIDGLGDSDFGVVYHAGRSLTHLTGQRFGTDSMRWRTWAGSVDDFFAQRGAADRRQQSAAPRSWWRRTGDSIRRMFTGRERAGAAESDAHASAVD